MRLSELTEGTPIRIRAYLKEDKITEIWGKIKKNSKNQCQIDVFSYEGRNINLNAPEYEIKATAFERGEHAVEWNKYTVSDAGAREDGLVENREAFRIYIGIPVDCTIGKADTAALLVDLSEKGFRIVVRDEMPFANGTMVKIDIDDDDFDFSISGNTVWNKKEDDIKTMYGCLINENRDADSIVKYIKKKQAQLLEKLTKEIAVQA